MGIDVTGVFDDLFEIFDKGLERVTDIKALEAAEDLVERLNPIGTANAAPAPTPPAMNWTPLIIGAVGLLAVVLLTK